ncbi:hypothetical protein GCU67_12910 [Modestobacter muralis]|uniref:Uncharacterized protein n=1 Tax=Modestobacter muralis TaxID=1608614 RepID=A0A6P0HD56_9ACTN|nr:hypothetical protein [Modestobacter muralis]NEK95066.1 hypothetical protein [Modestobacter muralis]NEN51954.1 hypothetical protein [Modestobacter muralis]
MSIDHDPMVAAPVPTGPTRAWAEVEREQFAYQMLVQRGTGTNGLLWQTPSLALAAQAFLLTLSLGEDTIRPVRIVVSVLGMAIGFMSMQLMAKQHWYYELDQAELRRLERVLDLPPIAHRVDQIESHGTIGWAPTRSAARRDRMAWRNRVWALPWVNLKSYGVWQSGLCLIALANAAVLVAVLVVPDLLN